MARLVFIVSRERPELAAYLRREFAGSNDVDVILDRRLAERRLAAPTIPQDDRRQSDRRQDDVDDRLQALGWAIVWRHAGTTVYVHEDDRKAPADGGGGGRVT